MIVTVKVTVIVTVSKLTHAFINGTLEGIGTAVHIIKESGVKVSIWFSITVRCSEIAPRQLI